ncbi:MAG: hypothetical protein WBD02_06220 [Acidimicrobiia bacterium]
MKIGMKWISLIFGASTLACQCACPSVPDTAVPASCDRRYSQTVCIYRDAFYNPNYKDMFSGGDHSYANNTWFYQDLFEFDPGGGNSNDEATSVVNNTDFWVVFFYDAHDTRPMSASIDDAVACVAPQRGIPNLNDETWGPLFLIGNPNDEASSHFLYTKQEVQDIRFTCGYRVDDAGAITTKTAS